MTDGRRKFQFNICCLVALIGLLWCEFFQNLKKEKEIENK